MSFTSLNFWFLFPFIFVIYWLIPIKSVLLKKLFLVLVSYLLYMIWNPAFTLVLLFVTFVTYWGGQLLDNNVDVTRKRQLAWLFSLIGILPLLIFKYYNFLNENISGALTTIGLNFALPGLNYAIPIGISFYSFQAMGYMLDVYHRRIRPESNILDYTLFVSFFPQVMSGPISKANELLPQIKHLHGFVYEQGKQGLKWLLWGMFIKLVIADRLGMFVDTVYSNYVHYNGATCLMASIFYSIQIYCDFAGYSLMAIGIAATLGFDLINNFHRPYLAVSVTEFWRRWHISLTRWLTQQIYIPLGGSRCSNPRTYINIFVTFLVSGLWHGANWTFIVWGALHGTAQIFEKALGMQKYEGTNLLVKSFRIFITFMVVNFAWIFFRMPNLSDAFLIISKMFITPGCPNLADMGVNAVIMVFIGVFLLITKDFKDEFFPKNCNFLYHPIIRWATYFIIFSMILACGVLDGGQFIYVSF